MIKKTITVIFLLILFISIFKLKIENIYASSLNTQKSDADINSYKLQIEDKIRISVWGYPDLDRVVAILPDGIISFPPLTEKISVIDLTITELENLLTQKLTKYLKDIKNVQVSVLEYHGTKVFILGQVLQPGQYSFAIMPNVLGLITRAGGCTSDASLRAIRILRGNMEKPEVILVDLDKFLQTGDTNLLPILKSGDTVYVPRLGEEGKLVEERKRGEMRRKTINIIGEIKAPGVYSIEESLELIDVISRAGGTTLFAELNNIKIVSYEEGLPNIKNVNFNDYVNSGNLSGNPMIKAGDTIIIPTFFYEGPMHREIEPKGNTIFVLGEVYNPGAYQIGVNKNVWNMIQLSGGVTPEAYLNKIKIIKGETSKEYPKTIKLDITENFKKSDFSNLPALESGDTVVIPKQTHFWRETVKFFSEVAIIVGVVNLFNR